MSNGTEAVETANTGDAATAPAAAGDQAIYSPVIGTQAADTINGSHRADLISGRQVADDLDGRGGGDLIFGGSGGDLIAGGTGNDTLYGGGGPSIVKLSDFTVAEDYAGSVTFLNEGAGYRNSLGVYKVADDGSITDVSILFPNASKIGSGGDLIPGESAVALDLNAGDRIGFFIVSNGFGHGTDNQQHLSDPDGQFELRTPDGQPGNLETATALELWHIDAVTGEETKIRSQYGNDLFHSAADPADDYAPNPDNFPHTVGHLNTVEGLITLGFEDLKYGGDKDYDDTVFVVDVGQSNARVLDPNIAYADGGEDVNGDPDGGVDPIVDPVPADENDIIDGGRGADKVYGMAGNDVMTGGDGADKLWGNSGNDTADGGRGDDWIAGGKGDDILAGGSGKDEVRGDSGNDMLDGNDGNDQLSGGSGDDVLNGGSGLDTLLGGSGDDTLAGGSGNDRLEGGSGDDILYADEGADTLIGGSGFDTLDFSNVGTGVHVNLHSHRASGAGNDTVDGIEAVVATDYDDTLRGDKRANTLDGGDGSDWLRGLGGDDTLTGGDGDDRFVWRVKDMAGGSVDRITDFAVGDTVEIEDLTTVLGVSGAEAGARVAVADTAAGTEISMDVAGNGNFATFVVLEGFTGFSTEGDLVLF